MTSFDAYVISHELLMIELMPQSSDPNADIIISSFWSTFGLSLKLWTKILKGRCRTASMTPFVAVITIFDPSLRREWW